MSKWAGEDVFNAIFKAIHATKPPVAPSHIEKITKLALQHYKTRYKFVAHYILKFVFKSKPVYRLSGLYMIDAVVKASIKANGSKEGYGPRFAAQLPKAISAAWECEPVRAKIERLVNVWAESKMFSSRVLAGIKVWMARKLGKEVEPEVAAVAEGSRSRSSAAHPATSSLSAAAAASSSSSAAAAAAGSSATAAGSSSALAELQATLAKLKAQQAVAPPSPAAAPLASNSLAAQAGLTGLFANLQQLRAGGKPATPSVPSADLPPAGPDPLEGFNYDSDEDMDDEQRLRIQRQKRLQQERAYRRGGG
ncbi:uncharacterized protein AMSG_08850 [Thecamonas trahens ATCC 50062]|uniref:CID domain-containing protein n=1 Tax=Thecamonas trahens ATCC 50062 TaxID=461836 RepID=A0A0L0DPJ3_THETB|nr:hypothetical protein AMSG_08850 [Thecamonas trahens ATCC 50062]KNC53348.1 hypothetical protein AMSG_08850 [Thecamonas trahens ATCC 50062]|eukprot:XP_013754396.1 hypothetical protein AMSG_08850 [Thecamonas trahens ATCC 50062]